MATQLDLQEQEQLDALKAFWKRWGNLVTWLLTALLCLYGGWFWWQGHQRDQGLRASSMYGAFEQALQAGDVDRAGRVFADLKRDHAGSAFAQQAGLQAAKLQFDRNQLDAAKASLAWVADNGAEPELKTIARLRLAGVLAAGKQYDEALKQLDAAQGDAAFAALVADRRGDVLSAAGKRAEALAAYQSAWKAMDDKADYRRLVEAKLVALGAAPAASPASAAASGAAP